jgi:hypothetical protein
LLAPAKTAAILQYRVRIVAGKNRAHLIEGQRGLQLAGDQLICVGLVAGDGVAIAAGAASQDTQQ